MIDGKALADHAAKQLLRIMGLAVLVGLGVGLIVVGVVLWWLL